ncbi:hypothetical protein Nepgr_017726 [Nepenthes gracilis]|uniref:ubiquitinyl hydrolase 1 n=1 Tax=Nepenthes gracilis TaxID=150966 RepID=A0AAD3XTN5_NEPGR|nr:hypothetical protein Nepgr_017726 [Nepenthes gracilis]
MNTYEPDQDGSKWGLDFFDASLLFNSHHGSESNEEHGSIYHGQYMGQYHYNMHHNCVEDDTITVPIFESFRQLDITEVSESLHSEEEQLHSLNFASDWLAPSSTNDPHDAVEEVDDTRPSSSCSSPGEISYGSDEYSYYLELTDESALDGELGKRLNDMNPLPHVPRINGEIPSVDEATSDHQRLLDRLQLYDLVECKVQGDGNCQFRALSDQFYRTPEHHKFVRQQVVNQLRAHSDFYEGYVPMEYSEYLKKMSGSSEWGDHVTLQAAADSYGVKMFVITSFKDTCYIEILPRVQKSKQVIFLSFWAEVHYNSIYPKGELPPCETRRKKKWRLFGHKC